jgi:hypothetical protein
VHTVRSLIYQGLPNIGGLEHFGKIALSYSSSSFGLSESQKQHLQYAGTASVINIFGGDIYDNQMQEYKYLGFTDIDAFKKALKTHAPSYARLLDQFTTDNLFSITLTSVGQAVALANISNFIGKLDYTIWLK